MDKLTMAHDYAMKCIGNPNVSAKTNNEIIAFAWQYADAMQAEADKREEKKAIRDAESHKTFMDMLNQKEQNHHDELDSICLEKWQPDWSQAPKCSDAWRMYGDGNCAWLVDIDGDFKWWAPAPSFDYQGNWQDSLRKRPQ